MFKPQEIIVESGSERSPIFRNLKRAFPEIPFTFADEVRDNEATRSMRDAFGEGKRRLLLARHRGEFLKKCPGSEGQVCCNYFVINFASNCPMDCSYCYLQEYLADNPVLKVFSNVDDLLREADALFSRQRKFFFRIGTGEIADSLALDPYIGFCAEVIPFFAEQPNVLLELKTKSDCVEGLLKLDPKERVVVSWSMNPQKVIDADEHGTASLDERLAAARRCQAAGYKLGSQNPQDNGTWGLGRVALPASVAPGAQATFNFVVTAPTSPGTYNFQWRMLRELVEWFGQTTPNMAVSVQAPQDNAAFVSQSVPTSMTAGQAYSVSVTMRNSGGSTWTSAAGYKLGSQNPTNNTTWGLNRVLLGSNVAPGATRMFSFTISAPSAPGSYNFQWRMLREGVAWFGAQTSNVVVSVQAGGPAPPSGLVASYSGSTQRIQLNWNDNSNNEGGFQLQFSYSGSAWGDLSPATVGPNVTSWLSGPNPPTGSYQFRVRAFAGGQYSAWSNVASLLVGAPGASIAWIHPAEETWGPAGTLTAAGYATNGSGGVQLVWRERSDTGVWGAWTTVAWQPPPSPDTTWSNTISSGNPTNRCHWFDAYVNYSGVTSAVFHYTGATGCP